MNYVQKRRQVILQILAATRETGVTMTAMEILAQAQLMLNEPKMMVGAIGKNLGYMRKDGLVIKIDGIAGKSKTVWQISPLGEVKVQKYKTPVNTWTCCDRLERAEYVIQNLQSMVKCLQGKTVGNDLVSRLNSKIAQLETDNRGMNDRLFIMEQAMEAQRKSLQAMRTDLNETDQFARTHQHKSTLTTMIYEAKQAGAKGINIDME